MSILYKLGSVFAALVIVSCATSDETTELADPTDDPLVGEPVERLCFRNTINGFSDWDGGEGLILTRGANNQYLVTLRSPCNIANRALRIGFDRRFTSSGCVRNNEAIFISDSLTLGPNRLSVQSCLIDEIYEYGVEEDESDEADT